MNKFKQDPLFKKTKIQLISVFAIVSLVIIFISLRAWFSFSNFGEFIGIVVNEDLKATVLSYRLSEKTSLATSALQPLYNARNTKAREQTFQKIAQIEEILTGTIQEIQSTDLIKKEDTAELKATIEQILTGSQELNSITSQRIALQKDMATIFRSITQSDREILEFMAPLTDNAEFAVALASESESQSSDTIHDRTIYEQLTNLLHLKAKISLMYGLFLEVDSVKEVFDVQPLKERFIAAHHHAKILVEKLKTNEYYEELYQKITCFSDYGLAEQSVFSIHQSILRTQEKALKNITRSAELAAELSERVSQITDEIEIRVQSNTKSTSDHLDREKLIIVLSNLIALIAALIVAWLYSRTSLQFQRKLMTEILERKKAERDMRDAKDKAVKSSEVKSEFLAVMSHEIRTPMNSIVGFSNLLLKEKLGVKGKEYAATIKDASSALSTILEDILTFSKLESGKVDIESIPVDLRVLLNEVVTLFILKAKENKIYLKAEVDKSIPKYIQGDPSRLRQIIINLVSNAIKFTHKGGITLSAKLDTKDKNIIISVKDTGIGIEKTAQSRLFNKFEQADSSTTRKYGGIGLGLAISKKLINLMGGEIHINSIFGKGTEFWFDHPLVKSKKQTVQAEQKSKLAAIKTVAQDKHILIAEDNPFNQKLITEILKRIGYPFTIVENGKLAVEQAKKGIYDLILMDMQMPVMGGLEATEEIRTLPGALGKIPIVALSANAMKEDIDRCLAVGMQKHLEKPLNQIKLENILYDYLEVSDEKKK